MSFKLKNKKSLSNYLLQVADRIETALIFQLEILVATLENHAKEAAGYEDQTANLKGSIGGVVLKDGKPVGYRGFNSDGEEGNREGKNFLDSLIGQYGQGYTVLIVAGMEYATYVENYHNLNVLKKSELEMERQLPRIMNRLKLKIK